MLDFERFDESMWMLGNIFPLGSPQKRIELQKKLGINIALDNFVGILMKSLVEMVKAYPEEAEGYLDFIKESIQYSEHEIDSPPIVDYDPEEVKRLYEIKKIQENKN